jgi:MFS transporter, DHA2 family, multidrug resistance protein
MSAAATRISALAAARGAGANPWLIAVLVAFAAFMEVLDTTIANVALRYIAGGLGVSEDEASWVVTTYLVANAVILTASGFLAKKFGRKAFFPELSALRNGRHGLPLIFIAITTASYDGIPRDKTDQASALINAARNTGGSIGVSLVSNVLAHREQFHQSRLVEQAIPSSVQYQDTLHQVTNYFAAQGSSLLQAQQQAIAWIGQQVQMQASLLAYMDAFWVLMLVSLAAVPLALTLRKVKLGGAAPMGH